MAVFLTPLRVEKIGHTKDNRPLWKLTANLGYRTDIKSHERELIIVPTDFETDCASVPRVPVLYTLTGDTAHEAAVVHDWLYRQHEWTRKDADAVFYEAMTVTGESRWRAWLMWSAVRAAGWTIWRKYHKGDEPS